MSAEAAVHEALLAVLRGDAALSAALNGVFEGPATKATLPHAEIGELLSSDWGTKDRAGRELRLAVMVRDAGDTPTRIHALIGLVGAAIAAVPRDLDGWRIASLVPVRSRVLRGPPGRWSGIIEFRVRVMEAV